MPSITWVIVGSELEGTPKDWGKTDINAKFVDFSDTGRTIPGQRLIPILDILPSIETPSRQREDETSSAFHRRRSKRDKKKVDRELSRFIRSLTNAGTHVRTRRIIRRGGKRVEEITIIVTWTTFEAELAISHVLSKVPIIPGDIARYPSWIRKLFGWAKSSEFTNDFMLAEWQFVLEFLKARTTVSRGRVFVRHPLTKRLIRFGKKAYNRVFGRINISSLIGIKLITGPFVLKPFVTDSKYNNCGLQFLELSKCSKRRLTTYNNPEIISKMDVDMLVTIAQEMKISIHLYDVTGELVCERIHMHFSHNQTHVYGLITDNHVYCLKGPPQESYPYCRYLTGEYTVEEIVMYIENKPDPETLEKKDFSGNKGCAEKVRKGSLFEIIQLDDWDTYERLEKSVKDTTFPIIHKTFSYFYWTDGSRIEYRSEGMFHKTVIEQESAGSGLCWSAFSALDSRLRLRSYCSPDISEYLSLKGSDKILRMNKIKPNQLLEIFAVDKNHSYMYSSLQAPLMVPDLNTRFEVFDEDHPTIWEHHLYYASLKMLDPILGTERVGLYDGVELQILWDEGRVEKIMYVMRGDKSWKTPQDKISCELRDTEFTKYVNFLTSSFPEKAYTYEESARFKNLYRKYLGWITSRDRSDIVQFGMQADIQEQKYMDCRYRYNFQQFKANRVYEKESSFKRLNYNPAAHFQVMCRSNVNLYLYHKKILALNPNAKLVYICTDAIGYIGIEDKTFLSKASETRADGFKRMETFKPILQMEDDEEEFPVGLPFEYDETPVPIDGEMHPPKDQSFIRTIIDNRQSFMIDSQPGCGKTVLATQSNKDLLPKGQPPMVIDIIEEFGLLCIICTPTRYNSKRITEIKNLTFEERLRTLQYYVSRSEEELDELLHFHGTAPKTGYFIVDEMSLLSQKQIVFLAYIKARYSWQIILVGDSDQCMSRDVVDGYPWCRSYYTVVVLCDNNTIALGYNKYGRYTIKMYKFVRRLRKYKRRGDKEAMVNLIVKSDIREVRNIVHKTVMCYQRKTCEFLGGKPDEQTKDPRGMICSTVHQFQGHTHKEVVIFGLRDMKLDVIYTAFSRVKQMKDMCYNLINIAASSRKVISIWERFTEYVNKVIPVRANKKSTEYNKYISFDVMDEIMKRARSADEISRRFANECYKIYKDGGGGISVDAQKEVEAEIEKCLDYCKQGYACTELFKNSLVDLAYEKIRAITFEYRQTVEYKLLRKERLRKLKMAIVLNFIDEYSESEDDIVLDFSDSESEEEDI